MKNTLFAAVAALALVANVAPTFAAQRGGGGQQGREQSQANDQSSNTNSQCDNMRANPGQWGATREQLQNCGGGN